MSTPRVLGSEELYIHVSLLMLSYILGTENSKFAFLTLNITEGVKEAVLEQNTEQVLAGLRFGRLAQCQGHREARGPWRRTTRCKGHRECCGNARTQLRTGGGDTSSAIWPALCPALFPAPLP